MANLLSTFTDAARNLSRNPLGIIALFIVLVYGIAALVFGISGGHLDAGQKWPLIWFLTLFPVLVLFLFGWLVACHHTKLYSPTDYPDKEGFFRALSPQEQRTRLDEEARELATEAPTTPPDTESSASVENVMTSRLLSDVRSRYMIAEELVFRELQAEFGQGIQRHVGIHGADFGIDGLLMDRGRLTAIEVKFSRMPRWRNIFRTALSHVQRMISRLPPGARFVIAIVTEGLTDAQRKKESAAVQDLLRDYQRRGEVEGVSYSIELRVYDFDELRQKYGLTEEA